MNHEDADFGHASHARDEHEIAGSPYETMRRIMARHLCGWISGHAAPIDHFLVDADMIMEEAYAHGVRFYLIEPHHSGSLNDSFVDVRANTQKPS